MITRSLESISRESLNITSKFPYWHQFWIQVGGGAYEYNRYYDFIFNNDNGKLV